MRAVDANDSRTCFSISDDIVPIISLRNSKIVDIATENINDEQSVQRFDDIEMLTNHVKRLRVTQKLVGICNLITVATTI